MDDGHVERVPRLLRVREVAEITGLDRWRIYDLIKSGEGPPHFWVGRTLRIPEDGLAQWIRGRVEQKRGGAA